MDVKIQNRLHKNENDCWVDAIAYATKQSYEIVRDLFKPFTDPNGGLSSGMIDAYLQLKGFKQYTFKEHHSKLSLTEGLQLYNSHDNYMVIRVENVPDEYDHVVYIKNNVVYDTLHNEEEVMELLDSQIIDVFVKEEEDDEENFDGIPDSISS